MRVTNIMGNIVKTTVHKKMLGHAESTAKKAT
jgi:hypothetical protein